MASPPQGDGTRIPGIEAPRLSESFYAEITQHRPISIPNMTLLRSFSKQLEKCEVSTGAMYVVDYRMRKRLTMSTSSPCERPWLVLSVPPTATFRGFVHVNQIECEHWQAGEKNYYVAFNQREAVLVKFVQTSVRDEVDMDFSNVRFGFHPLKPISIQLQFQGVEPGFEFFGLSPRPVGPAQPSFQPVPDLGPFAPARSPSPTGHVVPGSGLRSRGRGRGRGRSQPPPPPPPPPHPRRGPVPSHTVPMPELPQRLSQQSNFGSGARESDQQPDPSRSLSPGLNLISGMEISQGGSEADAAADSAADPAAGSEASPQEPEKRKYSSPPPSGVANDKGVMPEVVNSPLLGRRTLPPELPENVLEAEPVPVVPIRPHRRSMASAPTMPSRRPPPRTRPVLGRGLAAAAAAAAKRRASQKPVGGKAAFLTTHGIPYPPDGRHCSDADFESLVASLRRANRDPGRRRLLMEDFARKNFVCCGQIFRLWRTTMTTMKDRAHFALVINSRVVDRDNLLVLLDGRIPLWGREQDEIESLFLD